MKKHENRQKNIHFCIYGIETFRIGLVKGPRIKEGLYKSKKSEHIRTYIGISAERV